MKDHLFYFLLLFPVFSHSLSLTFEGFSIEHVSNSEMKNVAFLSFI